jgi:hypothetical protein
VNTTPAKAEANRSNALHSTGPKSPAGKARTSKNAIRHGLLSRDVLLPDEDPKSFEAHRMALLESLAPVGNLEELLASRVVACAWRLGRLGRVEVGLFVHRHQHDLATEACEDAQACACDPVEELREALQQVRGEDRLEAAVARQREAEGMIRSDPLARLGGGFAREADRDSFAKLSRYEAGIERALYRALHELQRLQAMRAGKPVLPPVAVDIDVAGSEAVASA